MLGTIFTRRCTLLLALISIAACQDNNKAESHAATTEPPRPPQLADFARVSPTDSAQLEAARAPWQWAGALHHEAMGEALDDPKVPTYVGRGPDSPACAAQMRYAIRYAAKVDAFAINLHIPQGAEESVAKLGNRMGVCRPPNSAAVASTSRVGRYATQLASSLHAARNLADARRIIDAVHLDALHDPTLTADDLETVAALSVIAISSTNEWYPLGARKAETRLADSRIVAVTNDVSDPVDPDLMGCALMGGSGVECVIGALLASLVYWWPI